MSIFDEPSRKPIGFHGDRYAYSESQVAGEPTGEDVTFLHVIFAQTGFPYSRLPLGEFFQRRNGKARIALAPGYLLDPVTEKFEIQPLPYGNIPRKLMLHICNEAKRTGEREIDMNRGVSSFLNDEFDLDATGGKNGSITRLKEQMNSVAATTMTIGLNYLTDKGGKGAATFRPAPAIAGYNVWDDGSLLGKRKWNTLVLLSDPFFHGVMNHSVPLDDRAIRVLGRSPLRLDTYFNWAQRLHRIEPGKVVLVSYKDLHEQVGQEIVRLDHFVAKYAETAREVKRVYPDANVTFTKQGVEFRHSNPPVSKVVVQGCLDFPKDDPDIPPKKERVRRSKRTGPDPTIGMWKGD